MIILNQKKIDINYSGRHSSIRPRIPTLAGQHRGPTAEGFRQAAATLCQTAGAMRARRLDIVMPERPSKRSIRAGASALGVPPTTAPHIHASGHSSMRWLGASRSSLWPVGGKLCSCDLRAAGDGGRRARETLLV